MELKVNRIMILKKNQIINELSLDKLLEKVQNDKG
jgi:hypothetical protein